MARVRLARVAWPEALAAARLRRPRGVSYAALESLAACFSSDYAPAAKAVHEAIRVEPLNPLHGLRMALLQARFGDLQEASQSLDRLKAKLPETAIIDYLRTLFTLRSGSLDKARSMAGALETLHAAMLPAKFLRAEVQIVTAKAATAEKYLMALPSGPQWEPLWADLLVKLVLLHPTDGTAAAQRHLAKKLPKESPARALVERVIGWAEADIDQLAAVIGEQTPDSLGEELLLECLLVKLNAEGNEGALKILQRLGCKNSERPALRRVYDAFLTRRAAELSGEGKHEAALRLVERCVRRQPYDLVYHQNRAALFTLLRERGAYQDSWSALNAHQYRLLLLGVSDPFVLTQVIKTHRLFDQHAHMSEKNAWGAVFRLVTDEAGTKPRQVVFQEEITADPELLRQWMHNKRAVLVFQHVKLGGNGRQALLDPAGRDEAVERAAALTMLSESLRVLVPEEGADLAGVLNRRWQWLAAEVPTRYNIAKSKTSGSEQGAEAAAEDADTAPQGAIKSEEALLKEEHLITLAELCLLCLQWRPAPTQLALAEEVLVFAAAEIAFFDDQLLRRIELTAGYETPYPVQVLAARARSTAGTDKTILTAEQRRHTVEKCMAELLRTMAWSAHNGYSGSTKESATRALTYVDRARSLNPVDARIELTAAQLLSLGEYFDDSRVALERFRKLADPDDEQAREDASKLAELLQERRKEGKTSVRRQAEAGGAEAEEGREARIAELELEIDRSPGAWRLYEELVNELAAAGRFDDAILWADRSVGQCLGRAEQMSARGLAILARGMHRLSGVDPQAARLLAVGAHEPARKALENLDHERDLNYIELYVLGCCNLAVGLPEKAQVNFQKAVQVCNRPLYATVLRSLAGNIDSAYVSFARAGVNDALNDGRLTDALEEASSVFGRLKDPTGWLLDFARVYYSVALNRVSVQEATPTPEAHFEAEWRPEFDAALGRSSEVERAVALAQLAEKVHEPSAKQAQVLAERGKALQRRVEAMEVLNQVGSLVGAKKFDAALELLDKKDEAVGREPRLQRLRALALLGLRRFDEADEAVAQIPNTSGKDMKEFVAQYPALTFRQRLSTALAMLREGKRSEADGILRTALAPDEKGAGELAYCRAFASALEGFELRRKGEQEAARKCFLAGLNWIGPYLEGSVQGDRAHITELYDRLEKEADSYARR